MDKEVEIKVPVGIKIFVLLYAVIHTVPLLIASLVRLLQLTISPTFSFVLFTLSARTYKILNAYYYPINLLLMYAIIAIIVIVIYALFIADRLNIYIYRRSNTLKFFKIVIILNVVSMIGKVATGTAEYGSGELYSVINVFISLTLSISLLTYTYSTEVKNFFSNIYDRKINNNYQIFFRFLFVIILAGILVVVSFLYNKVDNHSIAPNQQSCPIQTLSTDAKTIRTDPKNQTSRYTDESSGLSFNYPASFSIKENGGFVFSLKTAVSNQHVEAFTTYLHNSPVIEGNSISVISPETRLEKYKDLHKNDFQTLAYLEQNPNPFGTAIKASPKSTTWNTWDPDDFFGKGFSVKFSDTLDRLNYYPLLLDIYNSDQQLLLQLFLSYSNFTKAQLLTENTVVPLTESHGITWLTKKLQGPRNNGYQKDENSYVYIQGIGAPITGYNLSLPLIEIQNDQYHTVLQEDPKPSFYQADKNIGPLVREVMETMVINSK